MKEILNSAKDLKKNQTEAERLLWEQLQAKQMKGYKFRKQHPMGRFIADFICLKKKLVIELDGGQHALDRERDVERDQWFYQSGFEILRIWNNEVFHNVDGVLKAIQEFCN